MIHFIQLFGPSNMSLGCYVIAVWESKGEGIQWSNLSELIRHSPFPIIPIWLGPSTGGRQ